jgi:hypothetical protein
METWRHGNLETWTYGDLDTGTHRDMDTWTHGHMDKWTNGLMDSWTHGHMDTWTHGHMETWRHGRMDICIHGDKAWPWRQSNGKRKTEAQAIFVNPNTVSHPRKWKFVVCPFVDEETKRKYPFKTGINGLKGLNRLAHLC